MGLKEFVTALLPNKPKRKKRIVPADRKEGRDIKQSVDTEGLDPAMKATIQQEQERQATRRYITKPAGDLTQKGKKK